HRALRDHHVALEHAGALFVVDLTIVGRERDRLFPISLLGVQGNREQRCANCEHRAEDGRRAGHFGSACGCSVPRIAGLSFRGLALLSSWSPGGGIVPRGSSIVTGLRAVARSLSGITCRYSVVTVTGPVGLSPGRMGPASRTARTLPVNTTSFRSPDSLPCAAVRWKAGLPASVCASIGLVNSVVWSSPKCSARLPSIICVGRPFSSSVI